VRQNHCVPMRRLVRQRTVGHVRQPVDHAREHGVRCRLGRERDEAARRAAARGQHLDGEHRRLGLALTHWCLDHKDAGHVARAGRLERDPLYRPSAQPRPVDPEPRCDELIGIALFVDRQPWRRQRHALPSAIRPTWIKVWEPADGRQREQVAVAGDPVSNDHKTGQHSSRGLTDRPAAQRVEVDTGPSDRLVQKLDLDSAPPSVAEQIRTMRSGLQVGVRRRDPVVSADHRTQLIGESLRPSTPDEVSPEQHLAGQTVRKAPLVVRRHGDAERQPELLQVDREPRHLRLEHRGRLADVVHPGQQGDELSGDVRAADARSHERTDRRGHPVVPEEPGDSGAVGKVGGQRQPVGKHSLVVHATLGPYPLNRAVHIRSVHLSALLRSCRS
jgi:hypothetical protein